jgi:hypothetical protein
MFHLTFFTCVTLVVLSPAHARAGFDVDLRGPSARRLQQKTPSPATSIRVVNFGKLGEQNADMLVPEVTLQGRINVTDTTEPVQYGAYYLGPEQVKELNYTIATELVRFGSATAALALFSIPAFPGAANM